jgi:hypothetical protein
MKNAPGEVSSSRASRRVLGFLGGERSLVGQGLLPWMMASARSCTFKKVLSPYSHSQMSVVYLTVMVASPTRQEPPLAIPWVNFMMMTSIKVIRVTSLG